MAWSITKNGEHVVSHSPGLSPWDLSHQVVFPFLPEGMIWERNDPLICCN